MLTKQILLPSIAIFILSISFVYVASRGLQPSYVNQGSALREWAGQVSGTENTQVSRDANPEITLSPDIPDAAAPTLATTVTLQEARAIVENNCTDCHTARIIQRQSKSRFEWELVLKQMEVMGVHLSDSEKLVLLDYLAIPERP